VTETETETERQRDRETERQRDRFILKEVKKLNLNLRNRTRKFGGMMGLADYFKMIISIFGNDESVGSQNNFQNLIL
jgi:hypothetical protein